MTEEANETKNEMETNLRERYLIIVIMVAAGLVALGSLLTWATASAGFLSASVSGTSGSGDGVATLVLALLAATVIGWGVWKPSRRLTILAVTAIGLAAVISIIDAINVWTIPIEKSSFITITIDVGIGLWLVMLGSIIGTGLSVTMLVLESKSNRDSDRRQVSIGSHKIQLRTILYLLAALMIILTFVFVQPWSSFQSVSSNSQSSKSGSTSGLTSTVTTTGPKFIKRTYGASASFTVTQGGIASATVFGAYTNVTTDNTYATLKAGSQYVVVNAQICAGSSGSSSPPSSYGFSIRLSNGASTSESAYLGGNPQVPEIAGESDLGSSNTNLAPSACQKGWVAFEAPIGLTVESVSYTARPENYDSPVTTVTWS